MNSLEMLKSEEGQLNAVFACFGSAAQHGQFFEEALADFLCAYNRLCQTSFTISDLDHLEAKFARQTMGVLLSELRKHVRIGDENVVVLMDEALKKRNFLMHNFFRQRNEAFQTEKGRMDMLKELVEIGSLIENATNITNGMRVALERAIDGGEIAAPNSDVLFSMEIDVLDEKDAT